MEVSIVRFEPETMKNLVPELTQLLHAAYAPLAKKGMRYLASHQSPEKTFERLCEGEAYVQFLGSRVTGTISLVSPKKENPCAHYLRPGVFSFHQFAVEPGLQCLGLGSKLLSFIERRAIELGASELALDTSEHADHLIAMYKKRGYNFVQHVRWDLVNYRSVVLSKSLVFTQHQPRVRV